MKKAVNLKMIAILAVFLGAYGFSGSLKQSFLSVDKAYGGEEIYKKEQDGRNIVFMPVDGQQELYTLADVKKLFELERVFQGLMRTGTPQDSLQRQPGVASPAPAAADADKAMSEIDANGLRQDFRAYFSAFSKLETAHEEFERKMKKYQKDLAAAEKAMNSKNLKTRQKAQDKLKRLKAVGDRLVSEHETLRQSVEAREAQLEAIQGKAPSLALYTERNQLVQIRSGLVQDEMSPGLSKARITGMLSMLESFNGFNAQGPTCGIPGHSVAKSADAKADTEKDGWDYIKKKLAELTGLVEGKKSAGESFIADEYLSHLADKNSNWKEVMAYFKSGNFLKNEETAKTSMEAFPMILKNYADEYWEKQDQSGERLRRIFGVPYVGGLDPRNPDFLVIFGQRVDNLIELEKDLTTLKPELKKKLEAYESAAQDMAQKQAAYDSAARDKKEEAGRSFAEARDKKEEAGKGFAEVWMKLEATQALVESLEPILVKARKDDAQYQAILAAAQPSPDSARQPMSPEQWLDTQMMGDLLDNRGFSGDVQRSPAIDFNISVGSGQPPYYDSFSGGGRGGDPFGGGFDSSFGGGGFGSAPDPRAQLGLRFGGN